MQGRVFFEQQIFKMWVECNETLDSQQLETKMNSNRLFKSIDFAQPSDDEPIRSVVTQSEEAAVVVWYVKPGQRIAPHTHPYGQDTWTILSGSGQYQINGEGDTKNIYGGDIVVAHTGQVHGVFNSGDEPLIFISVVSPSEAGYQLIKGPWLRP